ncbi:MAG: hypothetical protein DRJ67_09430 [Thermoprotei archaeon]|nr:MAG: hypothetical protein DRJ67_09430 [Thermoprotei archaeon]
MPIIMVTCPKCGHKFVVKVPRERRKGMGAHYADRIRKLSPLHREILKILWEHGALPKRKIQGHLFERGIRVSGNSLSGRLSELAGMGYIECEWSEVAIWDRDKMMYRFRKTPVWYLTSKGRRYVREELLRR